MSPVPLPPSALRAPSAAPTLGTRHDPVSHANAWILDLDGVVWLADQPIPGAVEAIRRLLACGRRVLYLTNNSSVTVAEYLTKFARIGLAVGGDDLCTSAQSAAQLVHPGERVLVCAGPGVDEAVAAAGARPQREHDGADAVIVGFHRDFSYDRLLEAFRAIEAGARFIATNDDATYPTPHGPIPGGGSIVAAVEYATGQKATVAGKPYEPTAELVRGRLGLGRGETTGLTMVGDRPSTDGAMGRALGGRFALVLSGVTKPGHPPVDPAPDIEADDLASLVRIEFP